MRPTNADDSEMSMSDETGQLTHEFRLAAEYRRCGWYAFFGSTFCIGVTALLKHSGLLRGEGGWVAFAICSSILILPTCGLLFAVYRWRIRVDETGVARRRLWSWDLWKWDEFERGDTKRRGEGFISKARPWWRRELSFSLLSEKDRAFARGACRFFFQAAEPPPVELPDGEITLRYHLLRTVSFRQQGVAGCTSQGDFEFDWSDVKELRLLYYDHWSDELCRMELVLPGRTVRIEGIDKITGPGFEARKVVDPTAISKIVEDFLQQHAPREKLARHALHGPPASLSEFEHRRHKLQRELRNAAWAHRTVPAGVLMLILLWLGPKMLGFWFGPPAFLNAGWVVLVAVLTVATVFSQPLMVWGFLRERRQQLAKELGELDAWAKNQVEREVTEDGALHTSLEAENGHLTGKC